ncbi:MAG: FAD-dependent oxidoreductase [Candidatus Hydrogenedentales bacterium]|jgi:glycine/D-amino acid oxidase-like deaminating enzyme/nitrite reductase/ring-hydroxylating ferredoxin subunit
MKDHAGQSISIWMATATLPTFPTLAKNDHAEVCIVGAGIAGLTTAYLLGRAGKSVVVVDDGPIVSGETERTTAHLSTALDDRYFELERLHGEKGARLAAESHASAIDEIERIVAEEEINCDFGRLDGYLFLPPGESVEILERELAATHRVGLTDVRMASRSPIVTFDTGPALQFPRQAQFHPLKYLAGLAQAIIRDGGRIYTNTHATTIEGGAPARIETRNGPVITADAVIVATNTPVNDLLAIHTKQSAYRTFVIGAIVPSGLVANALYWDTCEPYHYVRLQPAPDGLSSGAPSDVLIVGGEDHKTGQADDTEDRYSALEEWARTRFPMMKKIEFRWSGQVMEPIDGLAFIGANPMDSDNVYIATGDSGNGMTHGTIAGMVLTDLIQGRNNPWASLYDPSRKTLSAIARFAEENLNVAVQYADWLTAGDIDEDDSVPPGTGAIVRRGLTKIAVYCDDAGQLHTCSAICPHLGGIVAWNHSEKTWDCPCHGSRFNKFGKAINGPANTDLSPVEGSLSPE